MKTAAAKKTSRARARRDGLGVLLKLEGKFRWRGDLDALRKRKPAEDDAATGVKR